jgi:PKHD-type hydroxylase
MSYLAVRILPTAEVDAIVAELGRHTFTDGKLTAGGLARGVKNNLQLAGMSPEIEALQEAIAAGFRRAPEFQAFAIPRRVMKPMFSRYEPGMEYGAHIDNAIMGDMRTDLSVTLFLSRPDTYDGGELVIHTPPGNQEIKLDAGEAIVYRSSTLHHVAPVTRGARLAAVTWVQSAVRDEYIRDILYDLHQVTIHPEVVKISDAALTIGKAYNNLLRYAAEA